MLEGKDPPLSPQGHLERPGGIFSEVLSSIQTSSNQWGPVMLTGMEIVPRMSWWTSTGTRMGVRP